MKSWARRRPMTAALIVLNLVVWLAVLVLLAAGLGLATGVACTRWDADRPPLGAQAVQRAGA